MNEEQKIRLFLIITGATILGGISVYQVAGWCINHFGGR